MDAVIQRLTRLTQTEVSVLIMWADDIRNNLPIIVNKGDISLFALLVDHELLNINGTLKGDDWYQHQVVPTANGIYFFAAIIVFAK